MINKKYEKNYFEEIVQKSINLSDVARNLGLTVRCGNRNTIKKFIDKYKINTTHFYIPYAGKNKRHDIENILVVNSTYLHTTNLKNLLYKKGLKKRECELCGQGELWHGKKMSLILDHKNGINNDNRIENLRIVCPNCNATLDTHGGKNIKK